jgi:hypothetical protein
MSFHIIIAKKPEYKTMIVNEMVLIISTVYGFIPYANMGTLAYTKKYMMNL